MRLDIHEAPPDPRFPSSTPGDSINQLSYFHHLFSTTGFRSAKMSHHNTNSFNHANSFDINTNSCENNNSFNNTNSFNVSNYSTTTDDRPQILTWLSPLEPRLRHRDIQESRVEKVGEWVLETEEFKSWYTSSGGSGSDNAVLFCYGGPGVGKTFIRY